MDLAHLHQFVESQLKVIRFPEQPSDLYDPIRYTLAVGGKRLRPVLVLAGAALVGSKPESAINQAIAIELFHNFTLLHDDIMDNAPLRRNQPTVVARWNLPTAILSGDVMFSEACRRMAQAPDSVLRSVLDVFFDAAAGVCEGQQLDMDFEHRDTVTIEEYLAMIRLKTAILLGASLQIGALCGGTSPDTAQKLFEAGTSLGIAFQIQDDLLDVFGDPALFGKQAGGDIISGKKTFLRLRAFEKAEGALYDRLTALFGSTPTEPQQKVNAVKEIFETLQVHDEAQELAGRYFSEGIRILQHAGFPEQELRPFSAFAKGLMERVS